VSLLADCLAKLFCPSERARLIQDVFLFVRFRTRSGHVPNGEPTDTDFTVQGKTAEGVLMCACTVSCGP